MQLSKFADMPSKRLGILFIILAVLFIITLAIIWNVIDRPFLYKEEIEPLSFSVLLKEPSTSINPQQINEANSVNVTPLKDNDNQYPLYGIVYLDRQCFYSTASSSSWINLSKDQQEKLVEQCNVQKLGIHYEWKSSFGEFLHTTVRKPTFYIAGFFFFLGLLFVLGAPQRLFLWIQKGE